jgi:hypothetical protein
MIINRTWAMPNSLTFKIKPIKELLYKYIKNDLFNKTENWIDCFANNSKIANVTNDLNPEFKTDYHLDALDFLKLFSDNSINGVLYDPPYSSRQISVSYKGVGKNVTFETMRSTWRSFQLDEIKRILKINGICISFGWNTNGVGKTRGFEIIEILIVAHGGSKNDTLVTVERKIK